MVFIFAWTNFIVIYSEFWSAETYTFQFKCILFSKHASKTEQILVRKHEANQDFHQNNTGKSVVKADTITKHSLFLQCKSIKLSHKTTDAAMKILQNLTTNSSLFTDKPNSPGEGCRESPCPQAREGTKERFFLPGDDTENDSPQKNVPHVGVPILQSNIAPARPSPGQWGWPSWGHSGLLTAVPAKLPPSSARSLPLPNDVRRDRCLQNPEHWIMLCSFKREAHKVPKLTDECFNPAQECPLG